MSFQFTSMGFKAFNADGTPLAGGRLYTYASGTTTFQTAYTDYTLGTPCAYTSDGVGGQYIALDSRGEAAVWLGSLVYTLTLKDSGGSLVKSVDGVQDPGNAATALQTNLAATDSASHGAGMLGYLRSLSYASGTIGAAIKNMLPNLKTDYGAKGDGTTDDTTAWQNALNDGIMFEVPPGVYKVTSGLDWKHGSRALGSGMWSTAASTYETTSTTVIQYAGVGGLNSYVVKVSDAAMGTNPSVAGTRDMQNCALTDVHIDGGDLAEFGLVEIRSWAGNNFDNISISNCRRVGCWSVENWVTGPRNRHCFKNRGAGAWLGKDYFSWGGSTTVDECTLIDWYMAFNGCDQSAAPLNTFADSGAAAYTSSNADVTCGLGIYGDRALKLQCFQAANNDGPGLYIATTLYPVDIDSFYMENNSKSSGASKHWSTWFASSGTSLGVTLHNGFFGSPSPAHRLAGTSTGRPEQSFLMKDVPLVGEIVADTGFLYRLRNSDRLVADGGTLIITGQAPTYFVEQLGTSRSVAVGGNCKFTTSAGALSAVVKRGVVTGLTRSSAGRFVATWGDTYATSANVQVYPAALSSGWAFVEISRTTTTYTFETQQAGVATDPAFTVGFMVIPDYD